MEQQSRQEHRTLEALAQARAGKGITLDEYVERSIAEGTMTREGYKSAVDREVTDIQANPV